jgi:hypothetical protein
MVLMAPAQHPTASLPVVVVVVEAVLVVGGWEGMGMLVMVGVGDPVQKRTNGARMIMIWYVVLALSLEAVFDPIHAGGATRIAIATVRGQLDHSSRVAAGFAQLLSPSPPLCVRVCSLMTSQVDAAANKMLSTKLLQVKQWHNTLSHRCVELGTVIVRCSWFD